MKRTSIIPQYAKKKKYEKFLLGQSFVHTMMARIEKLQQSKVILICVAPISEHSLIARIQYLHYYILRILALLGHLGCSRSLMRYLELHL